MMKFLWVVSVLLSARSVFVAAITTAGDHCVVQGLFVPQGETWQPAGKCVEVTCQGKNLTSTKGCSAPSPVEGSILIPEDPTKAYPDCCSKYVSPDSPLATKPPLKPENTKPPLLGTNSSSGEEDSETEVDSFESFDCCFECCYQCCVDLMNNRERHDDDSSEESIESYESEDY